LKPPTSLVLTLFVSGWVFPFPNKPVFPGECINEAGQPIPHILAEQFGLPFILAFVATGISTVDIDPNMTRKLVVFDVCW